MLSVHHEGRPDLFKGNVKKYTDEELLAIIADDEKPIFVAKEDGRVKGYAFCVFVQHKNDNILYTFFRGMRYNYVSEESEPRIDS